MFICGTWRHEASSGAESMNSANYSMRQRTAVDMVNAMLLLVDMEIERYKKQQTSAWSKNILFSPRGQIEFDKTFNNLNHCKFRIGVTEMQEHWSCSVKRIEDKGPEHTVRIPKIPIRGSYFGSCNCGVDKRDAVPCEHMAVVAAGSRVKNVTRDNIFPYWWTRSHWRVQIPQLPLETQKVSINSIKATNEPNHNLRYCPDWTASEVAGRPKKNKRKQLVLEKATGKKGQKKASGVKRARRYCQ